MAIRFGVFRLCQLKSAMFAGRGGTVLAMLGVMIAGGGTLDDGCRSAVGTAAERVHHIGVAAVADQSGPRQGFYAESHLKQH